MTKYSKNELKKYVNAGANIITLHVENFIKNIKKIVETLTETNCNIKKDAEM